MHERAKLLACQRLSPSDWPKPPNKISKIEVNKQLIDYFYGWMLKERHKDMQLHYAGLDRFTRRGLARVTMFL